MRHYLVRLRVSLVRESQNFLFWIIGLFGVGFFTAGLFFVSSDVLILNSIVVLTIVLTIQSTIALLMMIYAWNKPQQQSLYKAPEVTTPPLLSFTALLPVRHEATVIADTIRAVTKMDYPYYLKQIVVCAREDDVATIAVVKKTITDLPHHTIELVTFADTPINKPHTLNVGLPRATGDVVVVFDAEDEPHPDLYKIVNHTMIAEKSDVVQAGVQLVNEQSSWFSWFAVLEYYFWFRSALHFFARHRVVPLGGNTVFFRTALLTQVGGWDETCLTEDAALGFVLSSKGARIRVMYDSHLATREEAPITVKAYIKQRTRWFLGFLQILFSGSWLTLPTLWQKLLALFILSAPFIPALVFLLLPLSVALMVWVKVPVVVALFSLVPVYIVFFHMLLSVYGTFTFSRSFHKPWSGKVVVHIFRYYLLYQLLLGISSLRAIKRLVQRNVHWEKTHHTNQHRISVSTEHYAPITI